jgi:hypothetical protein
MILSRVRNFAAVCKTAVLGSVFYTLIYVVGGLRIWRKLDLHICAGGVARGRGLKLPVESNLAALHRQEHFHGVSSSRSSEENRALRFIAALSGFRAIVATPFNQAILGMGKYGVGPDVVIVPAHHDAQP